MNQHYTKDNRKFNIRRPVEGDADRLIAYSKEVFASTDQLLTSLEEYTITTENEKTWITGFNQNPNSIALVAEFDHQIVGLLFFVSQTKKKNAHAGEFGVSVHPNCQSIGIGKVLTQSLIEWAKDQSQIEKIFLQVFATNERAIHLYKALGFIEEGRHIKAVKQNNGNYVDVIQMYIEVG